MVGYWHMEEETEKTVVGGWVHTGDTGYYDERGFIYIVDRKKDVIITGSGKVYPREMEEVLYRHPAILEIAVIAVPENVWVERVHAEIVLKRGHQVTADKIVAFCKNNIAHYKVPRSITFLSALPKDPQGKILKREIRDRYWKGHTRKV